MKKEYDFSKGARGKFRNRTGDFNLPIYLEADVAKFIDKLSAEKKTDRSRIVNRLLKKSREMVEP